MEFLSLKPEAFGLDISDLSLKIVKIKRKGKFLTLSSFLEKDIGQGIIKEGEIKDEDGLVKIIKESLPKIKGEKLKTKHVVVSLPEEKAFLQVIQLPRMPEEDLKSAVIYEAENYVPLPIEEVYLDSQIVPPLYNHLDHFDVLIAALPKKIVDPYLSCLKKAGLYPKALEIESLAIARALIKKEISPFPTLLIDFGATKTSFIIFSGYSVRFTNSIPVSSQGFTEVISKTMNVDFKKAEELKIKYGLDIVEKIIFSKKSKDSQVDELRSLSRRRDGRRNLFLRPSPPFAAAQVFEKEIIGNKEIFETLIPALTDLTEQIKKCLDFYQTHTSHEHLLPDGKDVKKIFISGGGANLKGLADFLSSELGIPVALGNPWINILPEPLKGVPELPFEESLKYTTALGLALRGTRTNAQ